MKTDKEIVDVNNYEYRADHAKDYLELDYVVPEEDVRNIIVLANKQIKAVREEERERFNNQIFIVPVEAGQAQALAGQKHDGIKILGKDLVRTDYPDQLMYNEKPFKEGIKEVRGFCDPT